MACLAFLPKDPPAESSIGGWRQAADADARAIAGHLRDPGFFGAVAPLMCVKINFAGMQAGIPLQLAELGRALFSFT